MVFATVTLTGNYDDLGSDGERGYVEIRANSPFLYDLAADRMLSSRVRVPLDRDGAFSVVLPATDDPGLAPHPGRQYTLRARLANGEHLPPVTFTLPAGVSPVDVTSLIDEAYIDPTWTSSVFADIQAAGVAAAQLAQSYAADAAASAAAADGYIVADLNTSDGQIEALLGSPSSLAHAALLEVLDGYVSTPGPDIVLWGDSLTQGRGDALGDVTGHTVYNAGVWGESSRGIAARQGGAVMHLKVTGAVIPASGGVTVTIDYPGGILPLIGTGGSGVPASPTQLPGTLLGVPGVLTYTGGAYTFTRDAAGSAVATNDRPLLFVPSWAEERRGDIQIIWAGNNNTEEPDIVLGDVAAMVEQVTAEDRRYLVLGMTRSTAWSTVKRTGAAVIDVELARRYGTRFLNVAGLAGYFQTNYPLYDAGMDPTAQDSADIAAGFIPGSMLTDEIHYNAVGMTVLDNLIGRRLFELGWVGSWTPLAMPTSPRSYARVDGETGQKALTPAAGGAITTDATQVYLGTASVKLEFVFPGDSFVSAMWPVRDDTSPITIDGVFKSTPGEPPLAFAVQCYTANDINTGVGAVSTGGIVVAGGWQSFAVAGVPPAGTAYARLIALQTANAAAAYNIDHVRVRQ